MPDVDGQADMHEMEVPLDAAERGFRLHFCDPVAFRHCRTFHRTFKPSYIRRY